MRLVKSWLRKDNNTAKLGRKRGGIMASLEDLNLNGTVTVALLARVSTKKLKADKLTKQQDVASQFAELEKFCNERGWKSVRYDDAKSGKFDAIDKRPGLQKMLFDLNVRSDINGVLVTAADRMARDVEAGMGLIRQIISGSQKRFIGIPCKNLWADRDHYGITEMQLFTLDFMIGQGSNMQHAADVKRGIALKKAEAEAKKEPWLWGSARNSKVMGIDKKDVEKMYYTDMASMKDIAAKYKVSVSTIRRVIESTKI